MKALGMGWTVQDASYFSDGPSGPTGAVGSMPPVVTARKVGLPVGAGTDAHRVASYNPWTALQWFVDGKTMTGNALRRPEERPTREEALRLYTLGSAWSPKTKANVARSNPENSQTLSCFQRTTSPSLQNRSALSNLF
jgi:predicted amidohydrolase YtcJ